MAPQALYALTFGHKPVNPANHFYGVAKFPEGLETQFYFWCIVDDNGEVTLVDQGCDREIVKEMGIPPCLTAEPLELLNELGIKPEDIRHVILSHLHWDHFTGNPIFPNAQYYLHKKELDHVAGPLMRFKTYSQHYLPDMAARMEKLQKTAKLQLIEGESAEIVPGVEAIRTGGHSPGLLSVAVASPHGDMLICSDVAPRYDNPETLTCCGIHYNVTEALEALEKLMARAGSIENILPGHDPRITEKYPEIKPGVYQIF